MGASSSGLLDEAKINHIKGLVDGTFQSFGVFYRQQYLSAYFEHLHQEVEPKKEGKALLLTHRPQSAPEEVLYQGNVKFSCWDEQGKKSREKCIVLRRNYKVEIHENTETFSLGNAAKLVLQPAGGSVLTTEEESRAYLEKSCAGILNGVKEDSSSVVSSPDVFAVYLHLPYTGHTCFLFQKQKERDHFLSALETCIRHQNLDPWCSSSYENQAFIRALQLYQQDKGCYETWERLLGTEEQVLTSQVMEEVLPWLQSQLQLKVKGKKTERIRQWLATVQATYTLVLQQLTASLEALREECRQTASSNQALIRSNLDQIISSHSFLEQKVKASVCEEAEKVCSESVAPYMSSILEALTENISAGIQQMQNILHKQMNSAFTHTNGGTEETTKALSSLGSISLDQCYRQVTNLQHKLEDLKQRFGLSSTQRLVHSAHLEMEQLLDSAVYTLELFLQSSSKLQPSQVPIKMDRAKGRVLKQLDYDSRVVQRRLYQEALLEITLPALTRRMDGKWKSELQQFEQYIFSDYSSFILVHNVYYNILRNILSKEIETAVQDAASRRSNNLLLDTSDLAISQYSLLGQTPPRSAPGSPTIHARGSSSADVEKEGQTVTADVCEPERSSDARSDPSSTSDENPVLLSPVIVVTQQPGEPVMEETSCANQTTQEVQFGADVPPDTPDHEAAVTHEAGTPDPHIMAETTNPILEPPNPSTSPLSSLQSMDVPAECVQSAPSEQISGDGCSSQPCCFSSSLPPCTDGPVKMSLGSLSEAISSSSTEQANAQQPTDRAVYLTGEIRDSWEVEREKEEREKEEKDRDAAQQRSEGRVEDEKESGEKTNSEEKGGELNEEEGGELKRRNVEEEGGELERRNDEEEGGELERRNDEEEGGELEKTNDEGKAVELERRNEEEAGELDEEEGGELERRNDKEEEEQNGEHEEEEACVELPVDNVAIIRELVITEVEVTP